MKIITYKRFLRKSCIRYLSDFCRNMFFHSTQPDCLEFQFSAGFSIGIVSSVIWIKTLIKRVEIATKKFWRDSTFLNQTMSFSKTAKYFWKSTMRGVKVRSQNVLRPLSVAIVTIFHVIMFFSCFCPHEKQIICSRGKCLQL